VLEGGLGAADLTVTGIAAQLPRELGALGQARGAERMTLGDQAPRRVDDPLAAVGDGTLVDELATRPLGTEPEPFVGDELVGGEAVVELDVGQRCSLVNGS
jgi:hypothetical protein